MISFLAAVLGRVREIGVLGTLGDTKRVVLLPFIFESLLIALAARSNLVDDLQSFCGVLQSLGGAMNRDKGQLDRLLDRQGARL